MYTTVLLNAYIILKSSVNTDINLILQESVITCATMRLFRRAFARMTQFTGANTRTAFRMTTMAASIPGVVYLSTTQDSPLSARIYERSVEIAKSTQHRLQQASEDSCERPVLGLVAINSAVYILWRIAPTRFMVRNFTSAAGFTLRRPWTLITANYSHGGATHLGGNMLMLAILGPGIVESFGSSARFTELYTLSGAVGMGASALWKFGAGRRFDPTVGASGAVLGLFAAEIVMHPDRKRRLLGVEMDALEFASVVAALDAICAVIMRPRIALACHAGGALTGAWYAESMKNTVHLEHKAAKGWRGVLSAETDIERPLLSALIWSRVTQRWSAI